MGTETENYLSGTTAVVAIFVGILSAFLVYILKLFRSDGKTDEPQSHNENRSPVAEKKKDQVGDKVATNKKKSAEKKYKIDKQGFTDPWLVKSLKGHTGEILDVDFSGNNKYIVSCADDEIENVETSSTNSDETPKSLPSVESSPRLKGLTRRQKKNRKRDGSPSSKKKSKNKKSDLRLGKKKTFTPLELWQNLNMDERELAHHLRPLILSVHQLLPMGYPIHSNNEDRTAMIFKSSHYSFPNNRKNVSAEYDSGHGSGNSSDSSEGNDAPIIRLECFNQGIICKEHTRTCSRCHHYFYIYKNKILPKETCFYHWGKVQRDFNGGPYYSCCGGSTKSNGCENAATHVWDGLVPGYNKRADFVVTKSKRTPPQDGNYGIFALDCEMCYTVDGMEVASVTIVGIEGRVVYSAFVKPESRLLDYNTRFSGITARNLKCAKNLKEVQNDIMGFVYSETILIGHGLENDLRALRIAHYKIVDTALCFPHHLGFPYRCSLKNLASKYLHKEIQGGQHDSFEDAVTSLELVLHIVSHHLRLFC